MADWKYGDVLRISDEYLREHPTAHRDLRAMYVKDVTAMRGPKSSMFLAIVIRQGEADITPGTPFWPYRDAYQPVDDDE